MGRGSILDGIQRLAPWAFALLVLWSFALDPEGPFTSALCLFFSVGMMGYVISRSIGSLHGLDLIENIIVALVTGVMVPFTIYSAINAVFDLSWNMMTAGIIVPLVIISLVAMIVLKTKPLIGERLGRTIAGIGDEFRSMSIPMRSISVLAVIAIVVIASTCAYLYLQKEEDGFTEFYVLNEEGHAYDFPRNISLGQNATVIIGIANHEGREINYTVELWLVNYTNVNMAINVTQMYYVQSFSVVLEHMDYDLNDPWSPQFEVPVNIAPAVAGEFQLFIMLYPDGAPEMPEPGTYNETTNLNIVPSVSWRVVTCVNNEVNYLMLYVDVDL